MNQHTAVRTLVAALGLAATGAMASGFQLLEQNASGVGNAYSGTGATAEDASTAFFNPAAMPFMARPRQISTSLDFIRPSAKFQNYNSTTPAFITSGQLGGEGGDAGKWSGVPAFHVAYALDKNLSLGFSFGAPFGLKTVYPDGWQGRFQALSSDIKTLNANPSIAYRINDMISIGGGLSYQHFEATLSQAVNFGALAYSKACPQGSATPGGNCANAAFLGSLMNKDGSSEVNGDSSKWGWNIGVALQLSPSTRVGLSYRSAIRHTLKGDVSFVRPSINTLLNPAIAAATPDGPVHVDLKVPDTWTLSTFQQINDRWTLQGDIARTGWSSVRSLDIYRDSGQLLSSTYYNWRDTWRVALGGSYKYDDSLKLRAGVAFDQSPVRDDTRTPRLPDNNRIWVSFGANYKLNQAISLDAGYSHLFIRNAPIDNSGYNAAYNPGGINSSAAAANGTLIGQYKGSVDILALQMNYGF